MRVVKTIAALGRDVTLKELTVGEIRAWMADFGGNAGAGDVVDVALFEDATLDDLLMMSDLTAAEIAAATPSELAAVKDAAKEANRDFFSLRGRLAKLGEAVLRETPA
jgi:hypothetical protein